MTHEQRENIITLASNMYVTEGIKEVRMDDIARKAGVSKRTLYEEFGDKEELIYLSVSQYLDVINAQNESIANDAPNILIAIMRVMDHILSYSEINWKLHNSIRRFHPKVDLRIQSERKEEQNSQFKERLQVGVQDGLLNPNANLDLSIIMLTFLSTSLVTGSEGLQIPEDVTPQMAFQEILVTIMRGISTAKGLEVIDNYIGNIEK